MKNMLDFLLEDLYNESSVSKISGVVGLTVSDVSQEDAVIPEVSEVINENGLGVLGLEDFDLSMGGFDGMLEGAASSL